MGEMTDNRTSKPNQNETKSGQGFCFTEAQVEAAARALHETWNPWFGAYGAWGAAGFEIKQAFRESASAALVAAQGAARPVNGFDTSAERIKNVDDPLHVAPVLPSSGVDEYTREDLDQDTEFARSRWEAQIGETESFDRWLAEVERAAAAQARGEALVEIVQAHQNLHMTYGSTAVCRGGIGGQVMTAHCAEICYNADAHEKEMEAWQKLEIEAIEYSRARVAEIRERES